MQHQTGINGHFIKTSKKQWAVKETDIQVHSITTCRKEVSKIRCASVISLTLLQFSDKTKDPNVLPSVIYSLPNNATNSSD